MKLFEDFHRLKDFIAEWLTIRLQATNQNYWEDFVENALSNYDLERARRLDNRNLSGLDLRANLKITIKYLEGNRNSAPLDLYPYIKEMITIANKFHHIATIPNNENLLRAYDTMKRVLETMDVGQDFQVECISIRNSLMQPLNNEEIQTDSSYSNLLSLSELFDKRIVFRIPDFQRGFSWGRWQLEQFWEDINQLGENRTHYTGVITLEKVLLSIENAHKWQDVYWLFKMSPEFTPYYIIDGQQRITTILIILYCISKRTENVELRNRIINTYFLKSNEQQAHGLLFGYESNDISQSYFGSIILNQQIGLTNNLYTNNLKNAEAYFDERLNGVGRERLGLILNKIENFFKFNVYEVPDELDSSIIFETMNNRGKPLSKLELLKNRLIHLSTLLEIPDELKNTLRKNINDTWSEIYNTIGKDSHNPINDDEFLLNHYFMYFGYYGVKVDLIYNSIFQYVHEDEFEEQGKFTSQGVRDGNITYNTINNFVCNIKDSINAWFIIKKPEHIDININLEIKQYLAKINRLPYRAFDPCLMKIFQMNLRDEEIISLLQQMERFIVISFFFCAAKSHFKRNYFYAKANELHRGDANLVTLSRDMESALTEARRGRNTFALRFREDVIGAFDDDGFYRWKGINYILFEYEQSLRDNNNDRLNWNHARRAVSIEHVYPQTPLPEQWDLNNFTTTQRRRLCSSIGNLVLLSHIVNQQLQNQSFIRKKRRNRGEIEVGYFNDTYGAIEISTKEEWTEREILARGVKLLRFINSRWNIGLSNELGEQKKYLRLEFLGNINENNIGNF